MSSETTKSDLSAYKKCCDAKKSVVDRRNELRRLYGLFIFLVAGIIGILIFLSIYDDSYAGPLSVIIKSTTAILVGLLAFGFRVEYFLGGKKGITERYCISSEAVFKKIEEIYNQRILVDDPEIVNEMVKKSGLLVSALETIEADCYTIYLQPDRGLVGLKLGLPSDQDQAS